MERGIQGEQGIQGIQGDRGDRGDSGQTSEQSYHSGQDHEVLTDMVKKLDIAIIDLAVIKNTLVGNGSEGVCAKVDRHDRILWMSAGGVALISFVMMILQVFRR